MKDQQSNEEPNTTISTWYYFPDSEKTWYHIPWRPGRSELSARFSILIPRLRIFLGTLFHISLVHSNIIISYMCVCELFSCSLFTLCFLPSHPQQQQACREEPRKGVDIFRKNLTKYLLISLSSLHIFHPKKKLSYFFYMHVISSF